MRTMAEDYTLPSCNLVWDARLGYFRGDARLDAVAAQRSSKLDLPFCPALAGPIVPPSIIPGNCSFRAFPLASSCLEVSLIEEWHRYLRCSHLVDRFVYRHCPCRVTGLSRPPVRHLAGFDAMRCCSSGCDGEVFSIVTCSAETASRTSRIVYTSAIVQEGSIVA